MVSVLSKFAVHAALLLKNTAPVDWPDQYHLPEEPMGGRPAQQRGPAAYSTDARPRCNGTGTAVFGTSTAQVSAVLMIAECTAQFCRWTYVPQAGSTALANARLASGVNRGGT